MIKSIHDRRELQTCPALSRRMTVQRNEAGFLKCRIAVAFIRHDNGLKLRPSGVNFIKSIEGY